MFLINCKFSVKFLKKVSTVVTFDVFLISLNIVEAVALSIEFKNLSFLDKKNYKIKVCKVTCSIVTILDNLYTLYRF